MIILDPIGIRHWLIDGELKLDDWRLRLHYNKHWQLLDNEDEVQVVNDPMDRMELQGRWVDYLTREELEDESMGLCGLRGMKLMR